ncbi:hypothetical protein EVAR_62398_1 [Eumeta japonica]|uniref:Uncharacterized protein n=1 Tax=Eumeta variegata TaxID=151549 RepID=A0A4C1Z5T1_EUMVA|nr:hypothetical protein EVAR_62398_1 [Eumeta japonica]
MRAAALLLLAAHCTAAAETSRFPFVAAQAARALRCLSGMGPARCAKAYSVWRARSAVDAPEPSGNGTVEFPEDLELFPWERYENVTEDFLDSELTYGTVELLKRRSLTLSLPGFRANLKADDRGRLELDLYRDDETESGRGSMKKMRAQFYRIVPFLLLPGLLMSAVLPFILPAMKMMTVAAGIINQMALSGAIFTLLRNNAFNDKYDHKVVYANVGYKNEFKSNQHHKVKHEDDTEPHEDTHVHHPPAEYVIPAYDSYPSGHHHEYFPPDWASQYYGENVDIKFKSDRFGFGPKRTVGIRN